MAEVSHKSEELSRETANEAKLRAGFVFKIPNQARILIVSDNDSDAEQLDAFFRDAGFIPETARSITAACECARSDRFQVIFSSPAMRDGSWKRLIDIANHYDLGFEVVLLARNFDLADWTETLMDGAFDVVDVVRELSTAAEIAKRASWAAYLKGTGLCPEVAGPRKACCLRIPDRNSPAETRMSRALEAS
jgi:CheY-like chemotaxis protein